MQEENTNKKSGVVIIAIVLTLLISFWSVYTKQKNDPTSILNEPRLTKNCDVDGLEVTPLMYVMALVQARLNDGDAQYVVGTLQHYCLEEYESAKKWYERAIDNGVEEAKLLLGKLYYHGLGVEQDYQKSFQLFLSLATNEKSEDWKNAAMHVANAYLSGKGAEVDRTKGFEWLLKLSQSGFVDAYGFLGGIYYLGEGVPVDYEKAVYWLKKSVENDDRIGLFFLGMMMREGHGIEKNEVNGTKLVERAAEKEYSSAQRAMGQILKSTDLNKAIEWFEKAAAQGEETAIRELEALKKSSQ